MSDALSPILQWINTHPELAGLATFGISTAESVAIIGTIIPGTVMMTAIGTLAGAGVIPLWQTLFWAILGAIAGDGISYWIGRHFNERLPFVWPFRTHPGLLESGEKFFRQYGWMSVFIGRFVGPVRALVPLVAGMMGMPPVRFYAANILSAIGWAPAYMLPGIVLGAASLELPPDVAIHVIFMLLLTALCIMLGIWAIQRFFTLIGNQLDQLLTRLWNRLSISRHFKLITQTLRHHDPNHTHGQLVLTFYFLLTCCALLLLLIYITLHGAQHVFINNVFFHFFRSIRTPTLDNIMLFITFLGDMKILLPTVAIIFAWLAITKRWYTAWHVFALTFITAGGIQVLRLIARSTRPWGLLNSADTYSFPSGHATLSVAFYLGITFLFLQLLQIRHRRIFYYFTVLVILAISVSRLYLGAHWFTDIAGGWLLGLSTFILIAISYNRSTEKTPLPAANLFFVTLLAFSFCYGIYTYHSFYRVKHNHTQLQWPVRTLTLDAWWNQQGNHLPLYRINRFGIASQLLNLQWVGDLTDIEQTLLKNGWQIPPRNDWIDVLHRLSDVNSAEHLPLVAPIYLDRKPVLVLIKRVNGDKKLVVLRLWDSRTYLRNSAQPLWVGAVELAPRTYSWLFKRRQNAITVTPELIFSRPNADYTLKAVTIQLKNSFKPRTQHMLLIKPIGPEYD